MIVCAHQPNWIPGVSVISKVAAADVVIWEDELPFTRGYENRNRLPDGRWLTVPVERGSVGLPLNRVRLGEENGRGWRRDLARQVRRGWSCWTAEQLAREIEHPRRLLVGLNVALLRVLCDALAAGARWEFQSHLAAGHEHDDASERLAAMVAEVGGDTYLSGPSGRAYLDETPFAAREIAVRYWRHDGPNPCSLELLANRMEIAA